MLGSLRHHTLHGYFVNVFHGFVKPLLSRGPSGSAGPATGVLCRKPRQKPLGH